jgi:hypothetical protein
VGSTKLSPCDPLSAAAVGNGLASALCAQDREALAELLPRTELLVPARRVTSAETVLASGTGTRQTRIFWAFTDPEALGAWDRNPWPGAATVASAELARMAGSDEDDGPQTAVIVINAAGPAATILGPAQVSGRVPLVSTPGHRQPLDPVLADPAGRSPWRAAGQREHERGRSAAAEGDDRTAAAAFTEAARVFGAIGDRLHGAAVTMELATCHQRLGLLDEAVALLVASADVLASIGELDLGTTGLVDAAALAVDAGQPELASRLATGALTALAGPALALRLGQPWTRLGRAGAEAVGDR